jgi:hypothetical protein
MTTIELSIEFEIPEEGDPRYEGLMCFEVEASCTDPVPPWRGSAYSCPSSDDWYGCEAEFDGWESVRVFDLTLGDGGEFRDADPQEVARLDKWLRVKENRRWLDGEVAEQVRTYHEDRAIDAAEARYDAMKEDGW